LSTGLRNAKVVCCRAPRGGAGEVAMTKDLL
jgi:hypothetical protein